MLNIFLKETEVSGFFCGMFTFTWKLFIIFPCLSLSTY
ncbi:unnamed protein product [Arabidopsis halleri]